MQSNNSDDLKKTLSGVPKEDYGELHKDHVLDIYKTYLEMADRISNRREKANSFFLALNTAVVGFVGYLVGTDKLGSDESWLSIIALAGMVLSYLWYRIVRSYRGLNSAKFKVVHEIENYLPLKPYDAEWDAVGRGKDPSRYLPFTHIEVVVPWIFFTLHSIELLRVIPWKALCNA